MSRLSLIRFATYALFLAAAVFAVRVRYVIPLQLNEPRVEYHGGPTPTQLPGFADTKLSGSVVATLATQRVQKEGIDLSSLRQIRIALALRGSSLVWLVTWNSMWVGRHAPANFRVEIDDATGAVTFAKPARPVSVVTVGHAPEPPIYEWPDGTLRRTPPP